MIRGADTQFTFDIPYKGSDLESVRITFWQPENNGPSAFRPLPIVKKLSDCIISDKEVSIILEREETLRFSEKRKAYVQLVGITRGGVNFSKKREMFTVYPTCDETIRIEDSYIRLDGQQILESDETVYVNDGGIINEGSV